MNRLFTVKAWTIMVANITEPDGSIHSEAVGVMVTVAVGDRLWRAAVVGRFDLEASRDALHNALLNYFSGLIKVPVPKGNESKAWAAIINGYHQQISPKPRSRRRKKPS
jgi:hypothetical protein